MKKNFNQLTLLSLLCCIGVASGQSTMATSGGDATGSGGNVAFSLGQTVYQTYTSDTFTWTQGVQQPYEVSSLSVSTPNFKSALKVYPNPTTHSVMVDLRGFTGQQVFYQLIDLQGRLLQTGSINTHQYSINMNELLPATYLLVIRDQHQKKLDTFKIIKR